MQPRSKRYNLICKHMEIGGSVRILGAGEHRLNGGGAVQRTARLRASPLTEKNEGRFNVGQY